MGWIDRIPRAGNLYIGGLHAVITQPALFAQLGITHILSVIDYDLPTSPLEPYTHLHIRLEDTPNALLLPHFAATNAFIAAALKQPKGAVFVHCAMGKSRSAAVVAAYLMSAYGVTPRVALEQVAEARPVCNPNPGFREQLDVYFDMLRAEGEGEGEAERVYEGWLRERWTGDDVWGWRPRRARL